MRSGVKIGEDHQRQIAAEPLVAPDTLIIVEEIAAAVQDRAIFVDVDGPRVVRGMAVQDRNPGLVD
jgi:hypothetical protein